MEIIAKEKTGNFQSSVCNLFYLKRGKAALLGCYCICIYIVSLFNFVCARKKKGYSENLHHLLRAARELLLLQYEMYKQSKVLETLIISNSEDLLVLVKVQITLQFPPRRLQQCFLGCKKGPRVRGEEVVYV